MNRRGFISLLGAGAAGLALDPEMLLWRPGAKTIFIPSGIQHGAFVIPEWIVRNVVQSLENERRFLGYMDQDGWATGHALKIGDRITFDMNYVTNG